MRPSVLLGHHRAHLYLFLSLINTFIILTLSMAELDNNTAKQPFARNDLTFTRLHDELLRETNFVFLFLFDRIPSGPSSRRNDPRVIQWVNRVAELSLPF